jgi:hypothetical protein
MYILIVMIVMTIMTVGLGSFDCQTVVTLGGGSTGHVTNGGEGGSEPKS